MWDEIDGLVQEKRNSSAMELRLSCNNPSKLLIQPKPHMRSRWSLGMDK